MEISQQKLGSEYFEKEKDETEEGKETQQQERCLVCFDIALNLSYGYGARTCGNCAAFFKTTIDGKYFWNTWLGKHFPNLV